VTASADGAGLGEGHGAPAPDVERPVAAFSAPPRRHVTGDSTAAFDDFPRQAVPRTSLGVVGEPSRATRKFSHLAGPAAGRPCHDDGRYLVVPPSCNRRAWWLPAAGPRLPLRTADRRRRLTAARRRSPSRPRPLGAVGHPGQLANARRVIALCPPSVGGRQAAGVCRRVRRGRRRPPRRPGDRRSPARDEHRPPAPRRRSTSRLPPPRRSTGARATTHRPRWRRCPPTRG